MVERTQFTPFSAVDPQALLAQREARKELIASLQTGGVATRGPAPPEPAPAEETERNRAVENREGRQSRVEKTVPEPASRTDDTLKMVRELVAQYVRENAGRETAPPVEQAPAEVEQVPPGIAATGTFRENVPAGGTAVELEPPGENREAAATQTSPVGPPGGATLPPVESAPRENPVRAAGGPVATAPPPDNTGGGDTGDASASGARGAVLDVLA